MKKVNELLYVFVTGFILCLKKRSCYYTRGVGILDSPWRNNLCCAYHELGQGDFYSFNQEKAPFLLIYLLQNHKKSVTTKKSFLAESCVYHLSQSGALQACKTSDFLFLLLFLVSYPPPAMTNF